MSFSKNKILEDEICFCCGNFKIKIMTWWLIKAGILIDKTMDDKLKYLPNHDKQNYPLKLLVEQFGFQLNNQNSTKGYKTLVTSVIYSPMSPPSLTKEVNLPWGAKFC